MRALRPREPVERRVTRPSGGSPSHGRNTREALASTQVLSAAALADRTSMRALAAGQGSPSERGADRVIVLRHPVGHLAEDARAVETPLVVKSDNEGWSLYGAQRLQRVAIGGKWDLKTAQKRRTPLPWVATSCPSRSMASGALPLRRGGGHLARSARSAKSCEPEGPQDLTPRLLHEVDFASTARGVRRLDTLRRALRRRASPEVATRASGRRPRPPTRGRAPPPRLRARG